jgi:signal transduction histidine kinase
MNAAPSWPRKEILMVTLPALLTILFFVGAIFGVALPIFKKDLLEEKKQTLAAVTAIAGDILTHYRGLADAGELSLATAQTQAIAQIRHLRYGQNGKNYFWINNQSPRMIMHPYRPDLEGADLSTFTDPSGLELFQAMVELVKLDGVGFVQYRWQWNDDPNRIDPKLSRVQLFQPWGWIIGTGIYLDDVEIEIALIVKKLTYISAGILAVILLLSAHIVSTGVKETGRRLAAEGELNNYKIHLEELVEKRTAELQAAMAEVKILSGFLPICAACKNIRDDKGYWNQIESYIRDHSEAEFTHSICPDCTKKLYPNLKLTARNQGQD